MQGRGTKEVLARAEQDVQQSVVQDHAVARW